MHASARWRIASTIRRTVATATLGSVSPAQWINFKFLTMEFYYVYILQSEKDEKLYKGYTKNLKLRFERHQKGKVPATKYRRPLKLIYFEACLDESDAIRREKYLKTYYGSMFIKKRLQNYFTNLKS
jgi:putative endonuclease